MITTIKNAVRENLPNCSLVFFPDSRWWTVTMVDKWTGDPLKDVLVENVISSWNYSQINIPALFLQIGVYKLTYYLTLECSKIFPLTRSDFTHVEIIAVSLETCSLHLGICTQTTDDLDLISLSILSKIKTP